MKAALKGVGEFLQCGIPGMLMMAMLDLYQLVAVCVFGAFLASQFKNESSVVPTVRSFIPFLGSALAFAKAPNSFLRECQNQYGTIFKLLLAGKTLTFFTGREHFSCVLREKNLSFLPVVEEISIKVLGQDKEYVDPTTWYHKAIHKLFATHLSGSGLSSLLERTLTQQRRVMDEILSSSQKNLPLYSFVRRAIFQSNTRALFGDLYCDNHNDLLELFIAFDESFPMLAAGFLPKFVMRRGLDASERIAQGFQEAIDNPDLMAGCDSLLVERLKIYREVSKTASTRNSAGSQLGLLWAANGNSVPTVYWTLYHLLRDTKAWTTIRDEVDRCLPKSSLTDTSSTPWTRAQLDECVYLGSAIDEALRLSATSMILREAVEDTDLKLTDKTIPLRRGDRVSMFPILLHMDETIYPSPEDYQFDRFVNATKEQKESLRPFGMGANMCPGRYFAKNQIKMWIALVMQHMKGIRLSPGTATPVMDSSRLGLGVYPPSKDDVYIDFDDANFVELQDQNVCLKCCQIHFDILDLLYDDMPERALPSLRKKSIHLHPVSPIAPSPRARMILKKSKHHQTQEMINSKVDVDETFQLHIPHEGSNRSINDASAVDEDVYDEDISTATQVPKELHLLKKIQSRVDSAMQSYDDAMNRPVVEYDNNPDEYLPVTWKVGEILMATHEAMTMISGFSERPFTHDLDEARVVMSRDANDVVNDLAKDYTPAIKKINGVFKQTIALLQDMRSTSSPNKNSVFADDLHKIIDRLQKEKSILLGQLTETANMYTIVTESIKARDSEVKVMQDLVQMKTDELSKLRQELFVKQMENNKKQDTEKASAVWKDKYMSATKAQQTLELREKELLKSLEMAQSNVAAAQQETLSKLQEKDQISEKLIGCQTTIREQEYQIRMLENQPVAPQSNLYHEYDVEIKDLKEKLKLAKEHLAQSQQDHKKAMEQQHAELMKHFDLHKGEHGFASDHDNLEQVGLITPPAPRVLVLDVPTPEPATLNLEQTDPITDIIDIENGNPSSYQSEVRPASLETAVHNVLSTRRRTVLEAQKAHIELQIQGFINEVFVPPPGLAISLAIPDILVASTTVDNTIRKLSSIDMEESQLAVVAELQMQLEVDQNVIKKSYMDNIVNYRTEITSRYEKRIAEIIAMHKLETQQMASALQAKYNSMLEEKELQLAQVQLALKTFYDSIDATKPNQGEERYQAALKYQRTLKAVTRSSILLLAAQNEVTQRKHHQEIEELCSELKSTRVDDLVPCDKVEIFIPTPVKIQPPEEKLPIIEVELPEIQMPPPEVKEIKPSRIIMPRTQEIERPTTPPHVYYAPPSMRNTGTQVSDRDWMGPKELESLEEKSRVTLPHFVLEGESALEPELIDNTSEMISLAMEATRDIPEHWSYSMPALSLTQTIPPSVQMLKSLSKYQVQSLVDNYANTLVDLKERINWNKWQCVLKCLGLKKMEDMLKLEMHTSHQVEHALVLLRKRTACKRATFSHTHELLKEKQKSAWNACMNTIATCSTVAKDKNVHQSYDIPKNTLLSAQISKDEVIGNVQPAINVSIHRRPSREAVLAEPRREMDLLQCKLTPSQPTRAGKVHIQTESHIVRGVPSESPYMRRKALESIQKSLLKRRQDNPYGGDYKDSSLDQTHSRLYRRKPFSS
ncbi:cholesterol 7-alpha-monooxygenase-like isoform X2 [Thraustotheca clavata]|uniref:Cholesterol 7-alpha-monooxygenase-like isoform X2 n=1 Tax=Thraustotheca clavata TaxID=74557 RepID=A0A1V9ZX71_9STRA|nr:cholesterol 7-alpha-monooxygenase-like isoform X2 [Thraustotheca clavata]